MANTEKLPPSCRWGFLLIEGLSGGNRPGMVNDPEKELVLLEHGLAGHLGSGFTAFLHGKHLFNGPKSRAVLQRWVGFYTRYRPLLTCRTLPLRHPDGRYLDAVMHCDPKHDPCAVVVVFNPSNQDLHSIFSVPLDFAGWKPGRPANCRLNGDGEAVPLPLDDQGQAMLDVRVSAGRVDWWKIAMR